MARTNNLSEGWHNRFRTIVARNHPSVYAFIVELQKEQSDTESMIRELQIGRRVKRPREKSRHQRDDAIYDIVAEYANYVEENNVLGYLRSLSYYVNF